MKRFELFRKRVSSVFKRCDIITAEHIADEKATSYFDETTRSKFIQWVLFIVVTFFLGYLSCVSAIHAKQANDRLNQIKSIHENSDNILKEQYRWLRNEWFDIIRLKCELKGIKTSAISALIDSESEGKVTATSHKGAMSLMQIMPGTFAFYKKLNNPYDPLQNMTAGIDHFSWCLKKANGDYALAFMKYHDGPAKTSNFSEASIKLSMKCVRKMMTTEQIIIARM